MLNNLLDIVPRSDGNWYFDNWGEAVIYALIGFAVVFAGIAILIGIVWLVGFLLRKTNNFEFVGKAKQQIKNAFKSVFFKKSAKSEPVKKAKPVIKLPQDLPEEKAKTEKDDISDEIKVAIMAAIMAFYEQEQPKCEFVVKRIKRL